MPPAIGPILTSARSLAPLQGFSVLKIVPAWCPFAPAEIMTAAPEVLLRTSSGDPSAFGGDRPYPDPDQSVAEVARYMAARPDAIIEIGNEPVIPRGPRLDPHRYAALLQQTFTSLRRAYPRARLLPPAHCMDQQVEDAEIIPFLQACAPVYRQCHGLTLHAYSREQKRRALALLRAHVGAGAVWLTECNLDADLTPTDRAAQIQDLAVGCEAALVFHVDELGPPENWPRYRLGAPELNALRALAAPPLGAPAPFLVDIRQWPTVAAFRAHLAAHQPSIAPWATGVTFHHTVIPTAAQWRGRPSMDGLVSFYRDKQKWDRGPHLFVVGDCPDPRHAGIWQLTPLNVTGIHAASFNKAYWGIEMVGNFDRTPPGPDTAVLAVGAAAALLDWRRLPTNTNGHRDDPLTDKTCPGTAVNLAAMRRATIALRER